MYIYIYIYIYIFQARLGSKAGGIDTLIAFGFREVSEGLPPEEYLVLDNVVPEMVRVKDLLQKAVPVSLYTCTHAHTHA